MSNTKRARQLGHSDVAADDEDVHVTPALDSSDDRARVPIVGATAVIAAVVWLGSTASAEEDRFRSLSSAATSVALTERLRPAS